MKIDKIILYGSWAEGTQREDSDIDLVVISEDFKEKDFWQRINVLSEAIYEIFVPIEAIAFTPEEWERGDSSLTDYAKKRKDFWLIALRKNLFSHIMAIGYIASRQTGHLFKA